MTTYTKLRSGGWGLRGAHLLPGMTTSVVKKSGETKVETVGRVLWTGKDGVCVATIDGSVATVGSAGRGMRSAYGTGVRRGRRYECQDCGDWVTAGEGTCWETGLAH